MTEPKYLYRYRPFNDFSKDILTKNQLWFSFPEDFNDPFDCKVVFNKSDINKSDLRSYIKLIYKDYRQHPSTIINLNLRRDIQLSEDKFIHKYVSKFEDENGRVKLFEDIAKLIEFYNRHLKILCLSEKNDDVLMWSHYSDSHRGICLKFDYEIIKKQFGKYSKTVNYKQFYPSFKEANKIARRANYKDPYLFALVKSDHWEYEKEWRIIIGPKEEGFVENFDNQNYLFPPEMLTGVIFGCEMKHEDREAVKYLVQSNPKLVGHIKFHEAKKKPNEFGLNIVPLPE